MNLLTRPNQSSPLSLENSIHHVIPLLRRLATSLACTGVATAIATAPMQAQASQPLPTTATMSTVMSPTAAKLRTIMSLTQDPTGEPIDDGLADVPADAPGAAPEGPAPVAEGPAPAPTPAPMGPPPRKSLGMMISGAVITGAVALPLIGYGAAIVVLGKRDDDVDGMGVAQTGGNILGGVVIALGVVALSVGAPLLGVGAYRFSKYKKWQKGQQAHWSPSSGRTAHGTWTTGVTLRF